MKNGLFAKKSIDALLKDASEPNHSLKRTLGAGSLTMMGVGAIIGAGLFVLTGQAAAEYAGPGVVFSFLFAGILCVFAALCYAEFASMIPVSGSAYSYAYVTMGEFAAWTIGWVLTIEYLFTCAAVSVGWSGYFQSLLKDMGVIIPFGFADAPIAYHLVDGWYLTGSLVNLPAALVVGLIGFMAAIGIKAAARFNSIMVVVKMTVIVLFVGCGVFFVNPDNWVPLIPANTGVFGQFGWSGVLRGAGVVFFAYIGFDALSTLAQETRNPQKDLPLGMLGSLGISTLVYIVMALVMTGIVGYQFLGVPDPVAVAVNAMGPQFFWLRIVVKVAILAGLTSVVLVMLLGQTRVLYMMSHDGLLPPAFGVIKDRFQTPFFSTLFVTIAAMIMAGLLPVGILGQLVSMGTMLVFGIVCFGVLVLRHTQPDLPRPFRAPLVPLVPILGTLACLIQMIALPLVTWVQLIVWMIIGCAVYFGYGASHSKISRP
jgi:APA family basic amino acid/polyamine antiporter